MKVGKIEDYINKLREYPPAYQWPIPQWEQGNQEPRRKVHDQFPHVVTIEGHYPEMDELENWCWSKFGERDGKCHDCHSDRPACPRVLANDKGEHSHDGKWTTVWLLKTGYDYGFQDFCFSSELDEEAFFQRVSVSPSAEA